MSNLDLFFYELAKNGVQATLRKYLPTAYVSSHLNEVVFSWLQTLPKVRGVFIWLAYHVVWLVQILKNRKINVSSEYDLLVYVPNDKYLRYYDSLFSNLEELKIAVISDSVVQGVSLCPQRSINSYKRYILQVYIRSLIKSFSLLVKDSGASNVPMHLVSTIRQAFFVQYLVRVSSIKRIFSLHPTGDLHSILRLLLMCPFYSIRPTTTTNTDEIAFISTDYLYYKSEKEKEIYNSYGLDSVLIKGGAIYESIEKPKRSFNRVKRVLFIDTVTTDTFSSEIRKKALIDFYQTVIKFENDVIIDHKFHPGILRSERELTLELVVSAPNATIVDVVNWIDYDMVIGFKSTMFIDALYKGIMVVELNGEYNLRPSKDNPYEYLKIPSIESQRTLEDWINRIVSNIQGLYDYGLWKRFYTFYNLPIGKQQILKFLMEKY